MNCDEKQENCNNNETYASVICNIIALLKSEPGRIWTNKEIYNHINGEHGTIRTTLSRLADSGKIHRVSRGLYKFNKPPEMPPPFEGSPIQYHALHLILTDVTKEQGTTLLNHIEKILGYPLTKNKGNKFGHDYELGINRRATLGISNKTIELQLGLSKNPMTGGELYLALRLLDTMYNLGLVSLSDKWQVRNIEANQDDRRVSIEGIQCFKFSEFSNNLQIYNKPGRGLRREVRLKNTPLAEAWSILKGDKPPGWGKIQRQVTGMEELLKELMHIRRVERKHLDDFMCMVHEYIQESRKAKEKDSV
jgi:hypothetical protein